MQFSTVKEFPLDLLAGLHADGSGQGQWQVDVKPGLLPFGADSLDLQRVSSFHEHTISAIFSLSKASL